MDSRFIDGFRTQKRVVSALILRETKTLFGKHKLGFLWAIINASFQVAVFWVIREVANFHPPHGMSTPTFLFGGFVPWFIFNNIVTNSMSAIWANRQLLTFPQVYPLDTILARFLLQGAIQILTFAIMYCLAWLLGYRVNIVNPHALFFALSLVALLGLGVGALTSALNLMWHATSQIVPMVMRVLFFTSGLFFSVSDLPVSAREILYYNPLTHILEYMRQGFLDGYAADYIDLQYACGFVFISLSLGLLLERYSRRFLDRVV